MGMPESDLDKTQMAAYYESIDALSSEMAVYVHDSLHMARLNRINSMAMTGESKLWWPFTQHGTIKSTLGVGHGHVRLAKAASYAAGRYGHVIFPESVHEPAMKLAERLLDTSGKGWASRVFYTDDGSTAIEIGIQGVVWFDPPTVVLKNGQYHIRLPESISAHVKKVANASNVNNLETTQIHSRDDCLIFVEMDLHLHWRTDPRISADGATKITTGAMPVIFDEIFVGMYRLGFASPGFRSCMSILILHVMRNA
ncbi:hypothetical protein BSLG_009688 [Batrachochytrium salamandrivorans]|nr:hypothetical protein BSLG_009688 [Batrachochytrium salamandrivorans]